MNRSSPDLSVEITGQQQQIAGRALAGLLHQSAAAAVRDGQPKSVHQRCEPRLQTGRGQHHRATAPAGTTGQNRNGAG